MVRGTTPTHVFNVNVDLRECRVYVTYSQFNRIIVEKTNEDITINEDNIIVDLLQTETMRFDAKSPVKIQIRFIRENGEVSASEIMETEVKDILKRGVISYG